jgi:hypothetical protein
VAPEAAATAAWSAVTVGTMALIAFVASAHPAVPVAPAAGLASAEAHPASPTSAATAAAPTHAVVVRIRLVCPDPAPGLPAPDDPTRLRRPPSSPLGRLEPLLTQVVLVVQVVQVVLGDPAGAGGAAHAEL